MARSGKRARSLKHILEAAGATLEPKPARPGLESIQAAGLTTKLLGLYRALGGAQREPRVAPGPWDFALEGVVLELDEREHFNRYRVRTLDSPAYALLDGFDVELYRAFCNEHERDCQTYGGYWRNSSAEQGVGPAGEPGVLDRAPARRGGSNAPSTTWRRTLAPLTENLAVSRLSIWEEVASDSETLLVGELLARAANEDLTKHELAGCRPPARRGAGVPQAVMTAAGSGTQLSSTAPRHLRSGGDEAP